MTMEIETPELRGRIINSAIFLEDELDALILTFMTPKFKLSEHQKSTFKLIKKHFISGKTFGRKVYLVKDILASEVFKNQYFQALIDFFELNNLGIKNDYNNYEELRDDINSRLKRVNETRNIVAHGKINYDFLMGIDEIKDNAKDREFIHNDETIKISKEKEEEYNNDISKLIGLIKFIQMVIVSANFKIGKE